jgi:hypothetical protein
MRNKNPFLTDETAPAWAAGLWSNRDVDWKHVEKERRVEMATRVYDLIKYLEDQWYKIMFEVPDIHAKE